MPRYQDHINLASYSLELDWSMEGRSAWTLRGAWAIGPLE